MHQINFQQAFRLKPGKGPQMIDFFNIVKKNTVIGTMQLPSRINAQKDNSVTWVDCL